MSNTTANSGPPGPLRPMRRSKATRLSVLVIDRLADRVITIGGLLVIVAVLGILVFLVEEVVPLFLDGTASDHASHQLAPAPARVLASVLDEYDTVAAELHADGGVAVGHVATGRGLASLAGDFGGRAVTAFSSTALGDQMAFGFDDGTVRFGALRMRAQVLSAAQVPAGLVRLDQRDAVAPDGSIYSTIPGDQARRISVAFELGEAQPLVAGGGVVTAIDYRLGGPAERPTKAFATVDDRGVVRLSLAETRVNMLTRRASTSVETARLGDLPAGFETAAVLLPRKADYVFVAGRDGTLLCWETRDLAKPALVERARLLPDGVRLTAARLLNGDQSLVVGGSDGSVAVWFRVADGTPDPHGDGHRFVRAHALESQPAAVVGLAVSERSRLFATADLAGTIWLRHATSERIVARMALAAAPAGGYDGLVLSPRDDALWVVGAGRQGDFWRIDAPHPETTLGTLFGKVWYEGYRRPDYTWQSSSGTDSAEPKLSLVPLVFGTLKATVYSLLFAVPVALLGAIYTSEFVHARVRAVVKPTMELMASLPSVVLGFIAALVLAPVAETWLSSVFAAFVVVPGTLMAAAFGWQLLPRHVASRFEGLPKFALLFVAVGLGLGLAAAFGPLFERLVFAGDVKAWAAGRVGTGIPLTVLLSLPAAWLGVGAAYDEATGRWLPGLVPAGMGQRTALVSLVRALVVTGLALALAIACGSALDGAGMETRGGVVGTYVQRNTMVVGFAMGFAVIPLIYTLAEDALNAVPEHLRAASLACGGTPWQTAVWVILPAAASGVFAAIMVGMGRAVGETMIVVMAAGNTPLLDWNLFNGLRALSANIAVELPEAVKDGTLYRVLFLAALVLFATTFVINTAAEMIRQRFRLRAVQL